MGAKRVRIHFVWLLLPALLGLALIGAYLSRKDLLDGAPMESGSSLVMYKSPDCVCCDTYVEYLRSRGIEVQVKVVQDISQIKEAYKIPVNLYSCHTLVTADGRVIEGHVDAFVVAKFLDDKDTYGIALPGMPAGSPGMGGVKFGEFVIFSFDQDGNTDVYTRI